MNGTETQGFRSILDGFDTAMLVTRGASGVMHARPMALAKGESERDLWFATGLDTGKVDEILADSRILVTLQANGRYLSICGTAGIIRDHEKVRALWSEVWRPWFPEAELDVDLTLIHFRAEEAEYWDRGQRRPTRYVFEGSKALRRSDPAPEPAGRAPEPPGRTRL